MTSSAAVASKQLGYSGSSGYASCISNETCGATRPHMTKLAGAASEPSLLECAMSTGDLVFCVPEVSVVLACAGHGDPLHLLWLQHFCVGQPLFQLCPGERLAHAFATSFMSHRVIGRLATFSVVCLGVWWARPRRTRNSRMSPCPFFLCVLASSGPAVAAVCFTGDQCDRC